MSPWWVLGEPLVGPWWALGGPLVGPWWVLDEPLVADGPSRGLLWQPAYVMWWMVHSMFKAWSLPRDEVLGSWGSLLLACLWTTGGCAAFAPSGCQVGCPRVWIWVGDGAFPAYVWSGAIPLLQENAQF